MLENLKSEVKNGFKPLMNIVDIQSDTAHKMAREQLDFVSECLDMSARQAQTLRSERTADAFFRAPAQAGRELSQSWMSTAGRQWGILLEARDALSGEVRTAANDMGTHAREAVAEADAVVQDAKPSDNQTSTSNTSSTSKTRKSETGTAKAS